MQQEGNLVYYPGEEKHVKNVLTDNVSDIFKLPKSKDKLASGRQVVSDEVHTKFKFLCESLILTYIIIDEMEHKLCLYYWTMMSWFIVEITRSFTSFAEYSVNGQLKHLNCK